MDNECINIDNECININKENKKILNLEDRINNLPNDLKRKIYYDYFDSIYVYHSKVIEELNTNDCQRLSTIRLKCMIPIILNNNSLTNYFILNNYVFKKLYYEHLDNKKTFKLMNKIDSFALAWLYYLYH
jgi:hypothetical protein